MVAEIRARAQRRDRLASLLVVALVGVALCLGWVVESLAEGRTEAYASDGLSVRYPAGWVRAETQAPTILQVEDRWATPHRTTLAIQRRPIPTASGQPLGAVQQLLSLERGQSWSSYRLLGAQNGVTIGGRTGVRIGFAYVEGHPSPFLQKVPVVMLGEDFLFELGGQAYVVTLTAAEDNYPQAQRHLGRFIKSLQLG